MSLCLLSIAVLLGVCMHGWVSMGHARPACTAGMGLRCIERGPGLAHERHPVCASAACLEHERDRRGEDALRTGGESAPAACLALRGVGVLRTDGASAAARGPPQARIQQNI